MSHLILQLEKLSMLAFLLSSMLAMGLTLSPHAIVAPLRNLRLVLLALALNFVLAPALAWLLTIVIPLAREHTIGLLLLGGAAGAPFLPKLVAIARCDLALTAALIGLLTIGTILFLPLALPLMIPGLHAEPRAIARPLVLLIVLPLFVGMLVKGCVPALAARAAPVLAKIGSMSLLLFFILLIVLNVRALLGVVDSGAILAALLYFTGLFSVSWLLGGPKPEVRGVIGLATAARNFGAALGPASSSFSDPQITIMIIVGGIGCLIVTLLAAGWVRRRTASVPA
jgi:bile acid:Na+ symporter, BASS family